MTSTATLLALGELALVGCERRTQSPPTADPAPAAPTKSVTPPLPPPPIGRSELLDAIAVARSAYAAGESEVDAELAGRQFSIRQAFGCNGAELAVGAAGSAGLARWSWGRDQQTIEITLTPADWTVAPVAAPAGAEWEAVEGYWLTRPWLRTESCPVARSAAPLEDGKGGTTAVADSAPAPSYGHSTGLAAVFPPDSSRVGRRDGRAFTHTVRGELPLVPPSRGYRLVVEGRFSAFPSGRAIRCHSVGVDVEPVCIAAAEVDRVAFEREDGTVLREWRSG